jgi:hypothetical protein
MATNASILRKITLPVFTTKTDWGTVFGRCGVGVITLESAISTYLSIYGTDIYTDTTLTGKGTSSSKLGLAKQNASSGQVLTWNGTTWIPQTLPYTTQTLSLVGTTLGISGGNSVDLSTSFPAHQSLSILGQLLTISDSNTVTLPTQSLTLVGSDLGLTGSATTVDLSAIVGSSLAGLSDVSFSGLTTNQVLTYNGSNWVNSTPTTSPVPSGTGPAQILYWTGTAWAVSNFRKNVQTVVSGTTVSLPEVPNSLLPIDVYLNGILKEETVDYTIVSSTITFTFSFITNDKITTKYFT